MLKKMKKLASCNLSTRFFHVRSTGYTIRNSTTSMTLNVPRPRTDYKTKLYVIVGLYCSLKSQTSYNVL